MSRPSEKVRHAVLIGDVTRAVREPIGARFAHEPPEDVKSALLRAGYVLHTHVCDRCGGSGGMGGSSPRDCLRCEGTGLAEDLRS